MLTEIRIESLGAISAAVGEFDRGLTVLTGETFTDRLVRKFRLPVTGWRGN